MDSEPLLEAATCRARVRMIDACEPAPGSITLAVIEEDGHVNEMDRFRFNLNWYLYKLRAW
jgi:hypothetical protein